MSAAAPLLGGAFPGEQSIEDRLGGADPCLRFRAIDQGLKMTMELWVALGYLGHGAMR